MNQPSPFIAYFTILCLQSAAGKESSAIRHFIGSVASEVTCESTTRCAMETTDSYGCHFYKNTADGSSESCLIETYTGNTPKLYVKPNTDFKYIEFNAYHKYCLPSVLGVGNLGTRRLSYEDFHELDRWYEIKIHANKRHKTYQVILDEEKKIGRPIKYKSQNSTHIQIVVRGSALWSYECDPRDYQQLRSSAIVPWIMFFLLAILLVIILVCIIIYCSRKLKRQSTRIGDCNSFKFSTRSTISLISSPTIIPSRLNESRDSNNICSQSLSQAQVMPSASVTQSWSCASGSREKPNDQKWSYTANASSSNTCKKWVNSHMRFQNQVKVVTTNSIPENIYENPEENLDKELETTPIYENEEDSIYEEIDEFRSNVAVQNTRRPMIPFSRVDSMGSSFSAANSIYGYR